MAHNKPRRAALYLRVSTDRQTVENQSKALEAIAARQAGMEILGMSLITNLAAGIQKTPLSHEEVIQAGKDAEVTISALLAKIVAAL